MKHWIPIALGALLITSAAEAQLNADDYRAEAIAAASSDELFNQCPWAVNFYFDFAGKAEFEHERCKERLSNVQFAVAEIDVGRMLWYNCYCDEGLIITGGYNYMYLKWKNPYFDQDDFNTLSVALAGFTHRVCDWIWQAEVKMNATINNCNFSDYLTFDILLAGRYAWSDCMGIHAGFIALTGMRIDHVYPVIGIDWQLDDRWKLNLIFPLNMSLVYAFSPQWSMDLAGRFFDERHRVGENENWSRALVEYRSAGIELGLNFISCDKNLEGNLHAGGIIGGKVKVSNKEHRDSHRYRFDAAPYVGGDIAFRF